MHVVRQCVNKYGDVFETYKLAAGFLKTPDRKAKKEVAVVSSQKPCLSFASSRLRYGFLTIIGWQPPPWPVASSEDTIWQSPHEDRISDTPTTYRNTALSTGLADLLSCTLYPLAWDVVLLPLEAIVFRSVVRTYANAAPLSLHSRVTAPSSLHALAAHRLQTVSFGSYASKVGLCIALQAAVDVGVWGCAYVWTRQVGVSRFHWGRT